MTTFEIALRKSRGAAASIDRVWLVTAAILVILALAVPDQALRSVRFAGEALLGIAPFLAVSIAFAAYCTASGADKLVARAFQGRVVTTIVLAAIVGAFSPFCSCGVIPLIAALLVAGVPLAPVMAFWLASPLMDPSMFMLTTGTLGLEFAIAKTVAAVSIGLLGGFGMHALTGAGLFKTPLRDGIAMNACGAKSALQSEPVVWKFWSQAARREDFVASARKNGLFLGKWMTLAFVLESLMVAYIPASSVVTLVGDNGVLSIIGAAVVGAPAYLNGFAALPLVGGLMGQGMAPGAAMAFLVAGGVTSIPAAIAVFALARPPVFVAYVGFAFVGAIAAGLSFGGWAG